MTTLLHPLSMSLALLEWKIYADLEHSLHSYFDSVHVDSFGVTMMMHESLCSLWFSHRRGDESLKLNMTLKLSIIIDY
jgi:hypothetical protein